MTLKNQKIQKFISGVLVVLILVPSLLIIPPPPKAEAQFTDPVAAIWNAIKASYLWVDKTANVQQTGLSLKQWAVEVFRQTLKAIARRALAEMTRSTVKWINEGFHGAPLFLENPKSFFKDIGKFKIKNLVSTLGYDSRKYPFSKDYFLDVIQDYKKTFANNAQYSLSRAVSDPTLLRRYRENFGEGGWMGFMLHTQFPQNNVIGSRMTLTEILNGQAEEEVGEIDKLLLQGQGFLSPQTCPSNPNYPKTTNPYNPPSFTKTPFNPPAVPLIPVPLVPGAVGGGVTYIPDPVAQSQYDQYVFNWELTNQVNADNFNATYTCPGGLKNTTPGAVVASSIITSMNNPKEQASLNAAFGNSMAAIFDALLNNFMNKGLTALSNHINPSQTDNFDYYGATFSGTNDPGWAATPDQEIILGDFKKEVSGRSVITDATGAILAETIGDCTGKTVDVEPPTIPITRVVCDTVGGATLIQSGVTTPGTYEYVPGAIANTALEMQLIDNVSVNNQNPGLIQVLASNIDEVKKLDACIPGPDKGWETRLNDERDRIFNNKLAAETGHDSPLKSKAAKSAERDLRFAVASFKDWIINKMIVTMPSAIFFIDAVKEIDDQAQSNKELTDKLREKRTVLARLQALELALTPITTQPAVGSLQEKNLISIRKQFDAVAVSVGSSASIDDLQNQLNLAKERKQNLLLLNDQCTQERAAAGWGTAVKDGWGILPGAPATLYRSWEFRPMIAGSLAVNEPLLYRAFLAAKISLAGASFFTLDPDLVEFISEGTELEIFCRVPINSGYSHGEIVRLEDSNLQGTALFTFRNHYWFTRTTNKHGATPGYEGLPMVAAKNFYGDVSNNGKFPVSADIDCSTIFRATNVDYENAGDPNF